MTAATKVYFFRYNQFKAYLQVMYSYSQAWKSVHGPADYWFDDNETTSASIDWSQPALQKRMAYVSKSKKVFFSFSPW